MGATTKIWDLAHNLTSLGNRVTIFLPKYKFGNPKVPFKVVRIPFVNFPFIRFLTFNIFLSLYLVCYFFKGLPNLIYVRRMNSVVPAIISKFISIPLFYEVNDDPYNRHYHEGLKVLFFFRSLITSIQDKINLRLCEKAFIINSAVVNKIKAHSPTIDCNKLIVLPSGTNTDLFTIINKKKSRAAINLNAHSNVVGFAGTLLEHQGINILLRAADYVLKEIPDTCFLILGEGPMKLKWVELAKSLRVHRHFKFAGQIKYDQIPIWLSATDICVAPFLSSAGYRSPVKIFDYLACGKTVIASKIQGTTDIFEECESIFLIEPEDPLALADSIKHLLQNDILANELGKQGRQFVRTKFDRKLIAQKINNEALLSVTSSK